MFGSDPIGANTVGSLVASAWGMTLDSVEYAPIGYGSYHWYASGGGSRWLVTADVADQRPLAAAYELTHRLGEQFGFVRSPLAQRGGGLVLESDGWLITVWPWIGGRSGAFGDRQSPGDVAAIAGCLRQLHDYAEIPLAVELIEEWDIPGRAMLVEALGDNAGGENTRPYAAEMEDRIAANRSRLLDMLARFDDLAARVRDETQLVITHGEPHVANVVHSEAGPVLIDWDTVRWAPRERDLWWLPGESWRKAYGPDQPISEQAIEMYRLRWTLFDIADFVPTLTAAPESTPDLQVAVEWVRKLLPL